MLIIVFNESTQYAQLLLALPGAGRTALVWSPFDGSDYPYPYSPSPYIPEKGTAEFTRLDTSNDGILDFHDDPYAPYLPSNVTAIDWMGLSVFWQDNTDIGNNTVPPPNRISNILTGNVNNHGINFYATYVAAYEKPMMLSSTGAVYYTGMANPDPNAPSELAVKQAWWNEWLSPDFTKTFPSLKMISLSEANNQKPGSNIYYDFRIANKSDIFSAFQQDVTNATNFPIQWALPANLTTWTPIYPRYPGSGGGQGPGSTLTNGGFDFNSPASYAIVGFLSAAFFLVSCWIGFSFFAHKVKSNGGRIASMTEIGRRLTSRTEFGRIILVQEEKKEETGPAPPPVDDNSTICDSEVLRDASFQSQMTTSDEIMNRSDSQRSSNDFNRFGPGEDDEADDADSIQVIPPAQAYHQLHHPYHSYSTPASPID